MHRVSVYFTVIPALHLLVLFLTSSQEGALDGCPQCHMSNLRNVSYCISAISAPILKHSKRLVVTYGERGGGGGGGEQHGRGVQVQFYPYEKEGVICLVMLKGGTKSFWGSFITGA